MKIEENYAFYLFTFFQIIFLCHTIIFFTPVSFSGRHVRTVRIEVLSPLMHNNNNNNNTYIALIRMRSKRFTSTVLQYDLEI